MTDMLQIWCKNNNIYKEFPIGSSLLHIYRGFNLNLPYQVVSAKVNNRVEGLYFKVYNNKDVEFLDLRDSSGMRTYVRSLCFVLCKAVDELYPESHIYLEHPISKGYFCNLRLGRPVTEEDVRRIKQRMQEIIDADLPFERIEAHTTEVVELFRERGMMDKVKLLETSGMLYTYYYKLGDTIDYYYGNVLPSAGYIKLFDIQKYYDGLLLRIPNRTTPDVLEDVVKQEKMFEVFKEYGRWSDIMGVRNVGGFNVICNEGHATDIINVAEALQEKKIAQIADTIYHHTENGERVKIVLIAGPSSSGKTTFSKRLSVQLMTNGLKPVPLSLDDYFVDREETPLDEQGNYDYESLYALDLELFNFQLQGLLNGEEVEIPTFNFTTGRKEYKGHRLQLEDQTILILEGIHALNPELTPLVPEENKFGIYVSALTTMSLDDHNWIPTTDNRLLRRIIRDFNYRGYSAQETISRWTSVRAGEDKWIFPYQENADVMFNSALLFEFAVLRRYAEPILMGVTRNSPAYSEAYRLLKFLKYFVPIRDKDIPPTSLLREFLGGSSFKY
ncbi:MAG: nucleoside kinase [Bacteroides sp.]|nr:nucleoside kinase [Bacteroides sp.]